MRIFKRLHCFPCRGTAYSSRWSKRANAGRVKNIYSPFVFLVYKRGLTEFLQGRRSHRWRLRLLMRIFKRLHCFPCRGRRTAPAGANARMQPAVSGFKFAYISTALAVPSQQYFIRLKARRQSFLQLRFQPSLKIHIEPGTFFVCRFKIVMNNLRVWMCMAKLFYQYFI